jgi:hypothetical protein
MSPRRRTLLLYALTALFAVGTIAWLFYVPADPLRVYRAVPAFADFVSVHERPAERLDDVFDTTAAALVAQSFGVTPDGMGCLPRRGRYARLGAPTGGPQGRVRFVRGEWRTTRLAVRLRPRRASAPAPLAAEGGGAPGVSEGRGARGTLTLDTRPRVVSGRALPHDHVRGRAAARLLVRPSGRSAGHPGRTRPRRGLPSSFPASPTNWSIAPAGRRTGSGGAARRTSTRARCGRTWMRWMPTGFAAARWCSRMAQPGAPPRPGRRHSDAAALFGETPRYRWRRIPIGCWPGFWIFNRRRHWRWRWPTCAGK